MEKIFEQSFFHKMPFPKFWSALLNILISREPAAVIKKSYAKDLKNFEK